MRKVKEVKLVIAQVSDIHISPNDKPFQDIDVRANFCNVLNRIQREFVDLLVVSGDLAADEGESDAYEWVKKTLDDFGKPYVVMAGNHDVVGRMKLTFDLGDDVKHNLLYFKRELKGKTLLFLDSSSDRVSGEQLDWLQTEAAKVQDEVILFMHHPPALCGCLFMDTRYSLRNISEVREVLRKIPNINNVFVGHYHTEKFLIQDGKNIHITPSTFMQISTHNPDFEIEHSRPGWRMIEVENGNFNTEVHFLEEKKRKPTSGETYGF